VITHGSAHVWGALLEEALTLSLRRPSEKSAAGSCDQGSSGKADWSVLSHYGAAFEAMTGRLGDGGLVGVVSPGRGDGRSTVAAGLALAVARRGAGRVLLLELDVERPTQAARFGVPSEPGLGECLEEPRRLTTVTTAVGRGLWLLRVSAGTPAQGLALLHGVAESGLLDACRSTFTWTIADLPPVSTPGCARMAAEMDGCLLVGRHRRTRVEHLAEAAQVLPRPPIGFVMTPGHDSSVPRLGRRPLLS